MSTARGRRGKMIPSNLASPGKNRKLKTAIKEKKKERE
jgi:hypothetical protein